MQVDDIQTATVLGAGTMGHGIAQVLAMCGIETRLFDVAEAAVAKGIGAIRANLDKGVERGKVAASDRDAAMARLSGSSDFDAAVAGSHVVIEAVPEKLALKQD
ncbi:MAG: 3-hydroxyacyl-CoA dehydrogenase NAD-binding domain-containing protein, partial [Planctomycetota bacterium]